MSQASPEKDEKTEPLEVQQDLTVGLKTSLITGMPSAVLVKIGDVEHEASVDQATSMGIAMIQAAYHLRLIQQEAMNRAVQANAQTIAKPVV